MAFNRDRNSRQGGGFRSRPSFGGSPRFAGGAGKPRFGDRGDRGPVEMHRATCDNCRKECEVPFRPTSGKPIFCSNCFESQRGGSDSRRSERSEDRPMFDATCADCRENCQVPFRPSGDKPVFCSNCFGGKKNAVQPQYNEQFEALNSKLDNILKLLENQKPLLEDKKPAKKTKPKDTTSIKEE